MRIQGQRLIATVAALFVLQAPLCALACLPTGAAEAQAAEAHNEPPCHEQGPASSSSEPADSHDDCGCESSYTAVLASPEKTFSNAQNFVVLPPSSLAAPIVVVASTAGKVRPSETDLPPPNILLLKSTLLI